MLLWVSFTGSLAFLLWYLRSLDKSWLSWSSGKGGSMPSLSFLCQDKSISCGQHVSSLWGSAIGTDFISTRIAPLVISMGLSKVAISDFDVLAMYRHKYAEGEEVHLRLFTLIFDPIRTLVCWTKLLTSRVFYNSVFCCRSRWYDKLIIDKSRWYDNCLVPRHTSRFQSEGFLIEVFYLWNRHFKTCSGLWVSHCKLIFCWVEMRHPSIMKTWNIYLLI